MPRLARAEIFSADEIACVHVMARVVRRCFLLGYDSVTGKNYDHRKVWIETKLAQLAAHMGIDLLAFSILSNHFHLILRSRPDVVATWDDTEVARRWLMLCPIRKGENHEPAEPNEYELNSIRHDPTKLKTIRSRLSDIAWWMRLLCQNIGMRANREDGEVGKFWQARYKSVRILDEETLLGCAAYVDLNPVRAAIADTIEESNFTSVQRRVQALRMKPDVAESATQSVTSAVSPDACLAPVSLDERNAPIGPHASTSGKRCSDKGFLAMNAAEYVQVLDWAARVVLSGKRGSTPPEAPSIFERLGIEPTEWSALVKDFGRLFSQMAGAPTVLSQARSKRSHRRFHRKRLKRELVTGS